MLSLRGDGPDEARTRIAAQRKHRKQIGLVECDVQLVIHHGSARLHVGHVENVRISAAGEAGVEPCAYGGMRAVASGKKGRLALLLACVAVHEMGDDPITALVESAQFARSLDAHACGRKPLDQQTLVLILRKDQHVRKCRRTLAERAKIDMRDLLPGHPQVDRCETDRGVDDGVGDAELPVELERARMNDERARRRSRLGGLVHDADRTPLCASQSASTRPVGPAPAIRTSTSAMCFSRRKRRILAPVNDRSGPMPNESLA
jgi:hypothetical protein